MSIVKISVAFIAVLVVAVVSADEDVSSRPQPGDLVGTLLASKALNINETTVSNQTAVTDQDDHEDHIIEKRSSGDTEDVPEARHINKAAKR